MPSSGVGQANQPIFEYWLGAAAYDPEVIDRDLRRIKAMGLNAVSVFLGLLIQTAVCRKALTLESSAK